jgi:hypothetical protein
VVPAGTPSAPGHAWMSVPSAVGSETTFYISAFNPGIATCVVGPNTWSDPSTPPQVLLYLLPPAALNCYHW